MACRDSASASLCLVYAFAVIANPDQLLPARNDIDLHGLRTRVQTVLHEFLDHGRRPLDDLAGGDLVNQVTGELLDGHTERRRQRAAIFSNREEKSA